MWKKKKKQEGSSKKNNKNAEPPRTGHICSDAECVGQFGTASGNQNSKNQKVENRDSLSRQALLRNECIPEQEPTEAIWYIKIVIFLYSVSVLFPFVEGYSRAQIFVFLSFFFNCFFFSLSGCESFLPCSSLILLDKKNVCEHIVIISVAFWMSIAL